jgi:hypothetical protein
MAPLNVGIDHRFYCFTIVFVTVGEELNLVEFSSSCAIECRNLSIVISLVTSTNHKLGILTYEKQDV